MSDDKNVELLIKEIRKIEIDLIICITFFFRRERAELGT